ncbi:enoyl-CoA hydratase/isomerase family protein [Actinoplanes sp. NPDC051851]|uniref:enoyl-CoA hydratase/isomerase family protein n=1 Tax=Actinoplanes sp. NPDC051851 TaxID=3154753 RepID=UPI003431727B
MRDDEATPTVIARVTGHLGHLTLNRPAAINALTAEMVGHVRRTLDRWESSDRVRTVLITGAGERGLCAGGDIRALHADAVSGGEGALAFWADEYRMNAAVASYPKPVVTWMDGIVMGGGIGIAGHASVRLVTERSRLAMPEVGIGFHPDVGGSWLLAHAPGEIGTHLALTGGAVGAEDAILAGLADHFIPSDRLPHLTLALAERPADEAVTLLTAATPGHTSLAAATPGHTSLAAAAPGHTSLAAVPPGDLADAREWIDVCYAADSVGEIVERLTRHPAPGAQAAAKEIATKSPTSLAVTLRSVRTAATLPDLTAALAQEYHLSARMLRFPDFAEGVRAQIIDKDRNPRWQPLADIDAFFP